jgi:hypothetical protein
MERKRPGRYITPRSGILETAGLCWQFDFVIHPEVWPVKLAWRADWDRVWVSRFMG